MKLNIPPRTKLNAPGSALIVTLVCLVIVTVLTVTLLLVARYERASSALALSKARSEALADLAADVATVRLRDATADGMSSGKMWISEPGRIRVYDRSDLTTPTDYNLFSALPGPDTTVKYENNFDLNAPSIAGEFPIAAPAPGKTQANMKIGWVNLLANPGTTAASDTNPIVGRIAYWIDDESCKININTADGSKKEDLYRVINNSDTDPERRFSRSYGFGTPSEISLQALKDSSGAELSNALASDISAYAWDKGFNTASEIGRVPGMPAGFYQQNKFNLTHYNKTPEVAFHGVPRMYLFPVVKLGTTSEVRNAATGGYGESGGSESELGSSTHGGGDATRDAAIKRASGAIDFIYPADKQFSPELPQHAADVSYLGIFPTTATEALSPNRPYLLRIANAIRGKDPTGNDSFQWPAFNNVTTGFTNKYSPRQIDSISLQMFDLSNSTVFADQLTLDAIPSKLMNGLINTDISSQRTVIGLVRHFKLTELYIEASTTPGTIGTYSMPLLQSTISAEFHLPKYYEGVPLHRPYTDISGAAIGRNARNDAPYHGFNVLDAAIRAPGDTGPGTSSPMGSFWQGNLLKILDSGGVSAGFDLMGNTSARQDPDQGLATANHPYRAAAPPPPLKRRGGISDSNPVQYAMTQLKYPFNTQVNGTYGPCNPGIYWENAAKDVSGTLFNPGKPGVSLLRFRGGLSLWSVNSGGGADDWEVVPLDSLRHPAPTAPGSITASEITELQKAVMPVAFEVPVPGIESYSLQVSDPLVNKFPGDWKAIVDPTTAPTLNPEVTMPAFTGIASIYMKGGTAAQDPAFSNSMNIAPTNSDGDNPGYKPASSSGGDPLSLWLPRQDIRYPKQSRFPSVGALNYIRTGIIPEDLTKPLEEQHGTPWRSLNLSSFEASQKAGFSTMSGVASPTNYPDWAMLDLFTVPFLPQKRYLLSDTNVPPVRKLTFGGATEGKLNINNPRIPYPFDETDYKDVVDTATYPPPERTAPLEALFRGIQTSGGSAGNAYVQIGTEFTSDRKYATVDHAALGNAVQNYLNTTTGSTKKRFLLPGQLAEVPEVNAVTYTGVAANAQSRNDLLRQVVGATTTQSNVFSIWIVAQTIKKSPNNTNYGVYERGDVITGETRRRYLVERHLDYGKDGVPGNSVSPGPDTIVGTADDPIDANYNPAMTIPLPYVWRITAVEDVLR